jgi:Calcineurin-like phosphoesterase
MSSSPPPIPDSGVSSVEMLATLSQGESTTVVVPPKHNQPAALPPPIPGAPFPVVPASSPDTSARSSSQSASDLAPNDTNPVPSLGGNPGVHKPPSQVAAVGPNPVELETLGHKAPIAKIHIVQIGADNPIWGSTAPGFWQKLEKETEELLPADGTASSELIATTRALEQLLAEPRPCVLAFDELRASNKTQFVDIREHFAPEMDLWIIGDLHGDLLSWRALLHYAEQRSREEGKTTVLLLLGDLFDDGAFGHRVLLEVLSGIVNQPRSRSLLETPLQPKVARTPTSNLPQTRPQFMFVVGNHDVGLAYDSANNQFRSSVSPSDFTHWLNSLAPDSAWRGLALSAIQFFTTAPRAVLLPDGTLVSHGGVPHTDLHALLNEPNDLNRPEFLDDFVWTRAHETSRIKIPNRTTRGCQFGTADFEAFCVCATKALARRVERLVRGHDHVLERYLVPPKYRLNPLMTINAMCWRQRDPFGPFERRPVIARWVANSLPEIHQIEIPSELIQKTYGEPSRSAKEQ